MLGMHPELQERIYTEIINTMGSQDFLKHSDLAKLEFMDRFIKETLRLFPTALAIARKITENVEIGMICELFLVLHRGYY